MEGLTVSGCRSLGHPRCLDNCCKRLICGARGSKPVQRFPQGSCVLDRTIRRTSGSSADDLCFQRRKRRAVCQPKSQPYLLAHIQRNIKAQNVPPHPLHERHRGRPLWLKRFRIASSQPVFRATCFHHVAPAVAAYAPMRS